MKNMKVSRKLIVSFLLVIALTAVIGIVGFIGMSAINDGSQTIYEQHTRPLVYIGETIEYFQRIRVQLRNIVMASGNPEELDSIEADVHQRMENFASQIAGYREYLTTQAEIDLYNEIMAYYDVFYAGLREIIQLARLGTPMDEIQEFMDATIAEPAEIIGDDLGDLRDMKIDEAAEVDDANDSLFATMTIVIFAALALAVAIALFLAFYISGLISKPIKVLDEWLNLVAKKGDIVFTNEELVILDLYGKRRDEVGEIFRAFDELIKFMNAVCDELKEVADGNLTVDVAVRGEQDLLSQELSKMVDNLNNMFGEINTATSQVSAGSKQIADGAQSLAQGSTEQAASVQQLSSSISEIAQKTKGNADNAGKAAALANNIKGSAEKGNRQMDEMMTAVRDINASSQNISKVIKSIDDIAFQTNILALNAAVEAARAGQHGKGFAVVAEEVRNLAAKSAAAAKDTESLIADSIEKAELGSKIADETAASLVEIVSGIEESSRLVSDIATSSEEQSIGIAQVNTGVDQVAQVVQQNSATAEESAAASEEMSGQSDILEELVARFKLKSSGGVGRISAPTAPTAPAAESLPSPAEFDDGFGKY